jgi:hypothetical protein
VNHLALTLSQGMRNGLIIFGSLMAIILIVFIWAACIRKKPRRRKYRYQHSKGASATMQDEAEATALKTEPVRRKWRRPRRARRLLNPTLAEIRGLPPVRDGHTPPQGL